MITAQKYIWKNAKGLCFKRSSIQSLEVPQWQ
ncbi:MAG: hypothetical protein Ta2F_03990 [Termitinemataceae bacterium]|nr:MAG: hypothetical protein Ta2F_03990 [Termitinemataceae bacterium]